MKDLFAKYLPVEGEIRKTLNYESTRYKQDTGQ